MNTGICYPFITVSKAFKAYIESLPNNCDGNSIDLVTASDEVKSFLADVHGVAMDQIGYNLTLRKYYISPRTDGSSDFTEEIAIHMPEWMRTYLGYEYNEYRAECQTEDDLDHWQRYWNS